MSAQATNAAIRGDIEALHDLGSALLPHARKGLQQVNNLDVGEYIVLGSLVLCPIRDRWMSDVLPIPDLPRQRIPPPLIFRSRSRRHQQPPEGQRPQRTHPPPEQGRGQ